MTVTAHAIRDIIEEADTMVEMDELNNELALTEQGIDSLDMANIYLLIEEKYAIKVPDEDVAKLSSVDAIVSYLADK